VLLEKQGGPDNNVSENRSVNRFLAVSCILWTNLKLMALWTNQIQRGKEVSFEYRRRNHRKAFRKSCSPPFLITLGLLVYVQSSLEINYFISYGVF